MKKFLFCEGFISLSITSLFTVKATEWRVGRSVLVAYQLWVLFFIFHAVC